MEMTEHSKYSPELIAEVAQTFELPIRTGQGAYTGLCDEINHLIITNFNSLVNILYRLDVSEQKINDALSGHPGTDAASLIADLILERQLEKIRTRNLFKSNNDIPEEEKW
jgi:hypothetical protein